MSDFVLREKKNNANVDGLLVTVNEKKSKSAENYSSRVLKYAECLRVVNGSNKEV